MSFRRAVIGGSGFYDLFEEATEINVKTPYGKVRNITKVELDDKVIFFLPRHGPKHSVPPHLINYRANIYALHRLNVDEIIATNAVGSIKEEIKPGDFLIPDQFIDATKNRVLTFFDGRTNVEFRDGTRREGVVHLDYTEPYCPRIRKQLRNIATKIGEKVHEKGTYVCFEGPRFETPAEIKMYQKIGADVAGMTTVPEAVLARELRMCYATICMITNYGAGMQEKVTHDEVVELFEEKSAIIKKIIKEAVISEIENKECNCRG
ncbi:MAG: S-methyl-5'-thioadenosine phosphorylase [Candidatus Heimdallarchaeaceae archaeon]